METDEIRNEEIIKRAKQNIEKGERWHKKINLREIVFGYNDGSVSTLALLSGVTGCSREEMDTDRRIFCRCCRWDFYGYW